MKISTGHLNVYGAAVFHDDCWLIGDRAGLESLRKAIEMALETGSASAHNFASDGEGYASMVVLLEDGEGFQRLRNHYTDPELCVGGVDPYELIEPQRYRELATWRNDEGESS